ncbi:MAG: peptidoglycan-binding domain-containing protein [Gammaproteobacteria bacterium]
MNIKTPLTLAGALAMALGVAPLALAQYPSTTTPPAMATAPSTASSMHANMQRSSGMHNMHKPSRQETMKIQRALKQQGYNIQADGKWGPHTRHALMKFQEKNGLRATGRPDARTLRALGVQGMGTMQPNSSGTMSPSTGTSMSPAMGTS